MTTALPEKIVGYLNNGHEIAAEIASSIEETRCFVHIMPIRKLGCPVEVPRYLNSKYTMWEYWNYEFSRMTLQNGWEKDEWNYDRYLLEKRKVLTSTEHEFHKILLGWVPDSSCLKHYSESDCP